jgi:hypothetical protein
MKKLNAYTVDEWRKRLQLSSDESLGVHFGVSATTIKHYRKNGVLIAKTKEGWLRASKLRLCK